MKKLLFLVPLIILLSFNVSCNKQEYDYWKETVVGYLDTTVPDETDMSEYKFYTGTKQEIVTELLSIEDIKYNDDILNIVKVEQRYSSMILYTYFSTNTVLSDFCITFRYYDEFQKPIDYTTSAKQYVVGGSINSLLINKPQDAYFVSIEYYQGECVGVLDKFIQKDFGDVIIKKSTTTYEIEEDLCNVVYLTKDNIVVWGTEYLDKGSITVPRNYVEKYACLEVK